MATSAIKTVEILRNEIEKTKQSLVETDKTIKKITGRDGVENRTIRISYSSYDQKLSKDRKYEGRSSPHLNRKRLNSNVHPGLSSISSLNDDDDDDYERSKMSVASSVVPTSALAKSREDIIEQQNKDKEINARNKRMFGLLMGTLASFKTDGGKNERQEKKRREIEKRLQDREKEEKELAKKQRHDLFMNRKTNEIKLRRLQLKMDLVQLHEEWEEQSQQLTNFIRTEIKPNIYYLPKVHNKGSLEKLEKSKKLIEAVVTKRRKLLNEELKNILEGKKDKDDGEDYVEDEPPKKLAKMSEKQVAGDNNGEDSEAEIDKNIGEDFQISAVDESIDGGGDKTGKKDERCNDESLNKEDKQEDPEKESEKVNSVNEMGDKIETNEDSKDAESNDNTDVDKENFEGEENGDPAAAPTKENEDEVGCVAEDEDKEPNSIDAVEKF